MKKIYHNNSKTFKTKETHFYSGGFMTNSTGIKATIFGGNSGTAFAIGQKLLGTGTPCNFVHRSVYEPEVPIGQIRLFKQSNPFRSNTGWVFDYSITNFNMVKVRQYGDIGYRFFTYCPDLNNDYDIEQAIKDSDVVINLIGNNEVLRNMEDYEEPNVHIPRRISKICRDVGVKRLIHFSANGVDPDSTSKSLRTKWIGEHEVLSNFPNATIIRPTEILHSRIQRSFYG